MGAVRMSALMALRCQHGMLAGLCVVETCEHFDGKRNETDRCRTRSVPDKPKRHRRLVGDCHYNFIDMTGERIGLLVVLSRAPNQQGTAQWFCRCDCGEICTVAGISLRATERSGHRRHCPACRKRPGTVRRVS